MKPLQRRYAAAGPALLSPTLLSVSLTFAGCLVVWLRSFLLPCQPSSSRRQSSFHIAVEDVSARAREMSLLCRLHKSERRWLPGSCDRFAFAHPLPEPCGPSRRASIGLSTDLLLRLAPLILASTAPVRSTVFHIARDYRGIAVASLAVRFKGCSPQRARGRERLSHR